MLFPRNPLSSFLTFACVIALGSCLQAHAGQRPDAARSTLNTSLTPAERQQFKKALEADNAGRPQDAEAIVREIVRRHPNDFDSVEELGLLHAQSGELSTAIPLLERATRLQPNSAMAFANLGAAQLGNKDLKGALTALHRAAELDPKNAQNHSALGVALMQAGKPAPAAEAFGKAAAILPRDADLLYNWSVALLAAGQTTKAAEVAARIPDPGSSAEVQSLLGDIAEHQNQFKEAVVHYQAAAKADPSETNLYTLAMEFVRHWTFDPALKIFEYGLTQHPGSVRLLSGKGIADYANNNYAEAAQIFSGLLKKDPDNAFYARILGHSCNLMPDSIAGCDTLVDFAEKHPANAEAATYAAASILHRPSSPDNLALAEKLLNQAIAANPRLPDAYFQLGTLKQQQSEWEPSKVALEKAVALNPHLAKAHYRLALAYSHTGQKEKARAEFELQKRYSQQEKDETNARLEEVTTFLVSAK